MKDKFQMSSMGELTFFLGLQVQQKEDGIFISQDKYVAEILKKFNYSDVKSASTPVDLEKPLVKDGDADDVDVHLYRSMIGSLMYLTASRPDIMFAVCACARFQVTPKTSHLLAVKRIFRYLKGKPTLGLWYSRDSPFELVAYTDSDYAVATQDRKSTTRDLLTKGFDAGRFQYLVSSIGMYNHYAGTQGELNAVEDGPDNENDEKDKYEDDSSPKEVNTAGQHVNTASPEVNTGHFKFNTVDPSVNTASSSDPASPKDLFTMGASHTLEATYVEFFSDEDEPEVDLGNILNSYTVLTTPNTRIHKDHPIKNVIGDVKSYVQIRRMIKPTSEQGFLSVVYKEKTHDTLNTYLYACFLSQIEPTSIAIALSNSSWVKAMQEELLQFKLQLVWKLMDFPNGKRAIGTKWVFRNKKRGIVIRNKERLVAQGHRQEEGIDYEEVFAHVARIKAIRLFLAYASFIGFLVYQMDVKSAFLYGTIEEEVYVTQPPRFKDPDHPDKVYKVVKALYGLHQAPRAWYETLANYLLNNGFKRGKIDQTLFIKKQKGDILLVQVTHKEDGIFISQDKYVAEILKKFNYTDVKSASTPVDLEKPLVKDRDANDVDVHLYRSMIREAVKRIFRYLKGKPTLGLWYSRDSPFELVAYTDSDYAGATQDRKSTTGDCQFLGNRLISWQCKKQIVVATSTTEAEYVAATNCCGQ
ncbi:putative ribonuclease H-like domain-containing protein, partial [Tanacetum coccineum]